MEKKQIHRRRALAYQQWLLQISLITKLGKIVFTAQRENNAETAFEIHTINPKIVRKNCKGCQEKS